MILIILALLSSLSLAFLQKVGTETSATMKRGDAMQAHYLAESAANHAVWRMLNEPGFPAAGNVYYMNSLGAGRYGYKVRKPTMTTFATIATVGAKGDNVVNQGYVPYVIPSNVVATYGPNADLLPDYRRMIGGSLSDAADTISLSSTPGGWIRIEGCPLRKEILMGTIDGSDDLNLAVWNGTTWGNQLIFNAIFTSLNKNLRTYDIAYESLSGDCVVVGWTGNQRDLAYTVWNGTAWAPDPPQLFYTIPGITSTQFICAASHPGRDDILFGMVDTTDNVRLFHWNGDTFNYLGEIEPSTATIDFGVLEIVFEQQSGEALIIWSKNAQNDIKYCTWSVSGGLSATASLPAFDAVSNVIRVAADRTSDYIFLASLDTFSDINVAVWDGTTWNVFRKS